MKKTFIIGEIGINHQGDINIAKQLIDIASAAKCDCIKFQKRNPHICIPEHQKLVEKKWKGKKMTYLDYKLDIEFGKNEYDIIDEYCKLKNIQWSASPWDVESLDFINQYDIPFIKLPSAMLTHTNLIEKCIMTNKKLILSTGMSSQEEIDTAVANIRTFSKKYKNTNQHALLHCNSTYPTPINELNLSCIQTLSQLYPDFQIGYSGHEFRLGTSVAAIYLGASIIERHITIDRSMEGSDHLCSIEPQGLFKLISGIRELEMAYGDPVIKVTDSEIDVRKKLRNV